MDSPWPAVCNIDSQYTKRKRHGANTINKGPTSGTSSFPIESIPSIKHCPSLSPLNVLNANTDISGCSTAVTELESTRSGSTCTTIELSVVCRDGAHLIEISQTLGDDDLQVRDGILADTFSAVVQVAQQDTIE